MTQAQLAECTDLSTTYIANIECGKTWISDTTLEKISKALHTDFYRFFLHSDLQHGEVSNAVRFHQLLNKYEASIKKDIEKSFLQLSMELP